MTTATSITSMASISCLTRVILESTSPCSLLSKPVAIGYASSADGPRRGGHLIFYSSRRNVSVKKRTAKKSKKRTAKKRWFARVTTDSTHPPEGLFTKDAATIARTLASKKVSSKGPGSGMRMLTYFINRGGRNLTAARRRELKKAKELLSKRVQHKKPTRAKAA